MIWFGAACLAFIAGTAVWVWGYKCGFDDAEEAEAREHLSRASAAAGRRQS